MRINGFWSDAVTYLNYNQDTSFMCGMNSSNVILTKYVLNSTVAHDFEILQSYWKNNDSCANGPQVYADEEERASTFNYLWNHYAVREEPFIEVVSIAKEKKTRRRIFKFIIPALEEGI